MFKLVCIPWLMWLRLDFDFKEVYFSFVCFVSEMSDVQIKLDKSGFQIYLPRV